MFVNENKLGNTCHCNYVIFLVAEYSNSQKLIITSKEFFFFWYVVKVFFFLNIHSLLLFLFPLESKSIGKKQVQALPHNIGLVVVKNRNCES